MPSRLMGMVEIACDLGFGHLLYIFPQLGVDSGEHR